MVKCQPTFRQEAVPAHLSAGVPEKSSPRFSTFMESRRQGGAKADVARVAIATAVVSCERPRLVQPLRCPVAGDAGSQGAEARAERVGSRERNTVRSGSESESSHRCLLPGDSSTWRRSFITSDAGGSSSPPAAGAVASSPSPRIPLG